MVENAVLLNLLPCFWKHGKEAFKLQLFGLLGHTILNFSLCRYFHKIDIPSRSPLLIVLPSPHFIFIKKVAGLEPVFDMPSRPVCGTR